jgi:AAA+ ATPase superfamily predicted ATPase
VPGKREYHEIHRKDAMAMKTWIAGFCIERLMARAQRIFFVYGMRRSGNHACVGWLTNALEGESVALIESDVVTNFNWSSTGKTFFINDASTLDSRRYLGLLYRQRDRIRRAQFIIISAEDKDASYADSWRIPARSEAILVLRPTLNLMASRYQNLNRRAREGLGASMQSMKSRFFKTLKANLERPRGAVWKLERWRCDEAWRQEFLRNLGLTHDILPETVGLGSSFSGSRVVSAADPLDKRFTMVEPWDAWMEFIRHAAAEFPDVFSAKEHSMIRTLAHR